MNQPNIIDLNEYISQSELRLKRILERLEWSEEDTLKDFNSNSVAASFKKIIKKQRPSAKATYPAGCITKNSVVLESSKLQEILQNDTVKAPCNFRELQANFSREQKLKIYEHVIENTEKCINTTVEQKVDGEISLADILAQKKREEKHKKRRFRKSKPTHVEEVRCLVNLQMQALQQFMENKRKNQHQDNWQGGKTKIDKSREEHNIREERKRFEDYYRREGSREKLREHHEKTNDFKRRHRSRSKGHIRHKHKRHKRSSSKEISITKKRRTKSRSKESRKRHRSSSNEIRHEATSCKSYIGNNSKERRSRSYEKRSRYHNKKILKEREKYSRSRSSDRYNRSHYREISKDSKKYNRIDSYETYTRREENDYDQKSPRGRRNDTYCKYSNEKCYEIKQKSITETRKNCDNEYNRTKESSNLEKYKYSTEYQTVPRGREKPSDSKSSKLKQKKHKRS